MGLFTKDIKNMEDLFVHTLRDIYYAETQIVKALPGMITKASDPQLKQGFQTHLRETENHVKRLEQVFQRTGKNAQGIDCPAIDGIIEEANESPAKSTKRRVPDAALIAAAQVVEHLRDDALRHINIIGRQLGHDDVVSLLQQTLDEEQATDKKSTSLAEVRSTVKQHNRLGEGSDGKSVLGAIDASRRRRCLRFAVSLPPKFGVVA